MEWNMLEESKKLFPHWLDKSENSNFNKHLKILNAQQLDIRHKLKTIEWSRLLNKPLKIHKIQTEPHKWDIEFEVNVKRLKQINIYKNPTIFNNNIVDNSNVINGYYYDGVFYKNISTEVTNLSNNEIVEEEGLDVYKEEEYVDNNSYNTPIECVEGNHYFDLINKKYYKYYNGEFVSEKKEDAIKSSLIHSEFFIDNYSHFFRYVHHDENVNEVTIQKYVFESDDVTEGYFDEDTKNFYKTKEYNTDEIIEKIIGHIYYDILSNNYYIYENSSLTQIPLSSIDNYLESKQKYKTNKNGEYEFHILPEEDSPILHYDIITGKYYVLNNNEFVEVDDNKIQVLGNNELNNAIPNNEEGIYYICRITDDNLITSRIPLIKTEDITPIISNDKYVIEIYTWNDYHFLKGFPEIDFIDYNNNNIIDNDEKNYDNLNITIEKINDADYLTFRVHQYGVKLIEIFKDGKPIHTADFVVEKLGYDNKQINSNFAHIYNYNTNEVYYPHEKDSDSLEEVRLDVDEYVWRLKLNHEDKIFDEYGNWNYELKNKYDIKVTYVHPYNSTYDKILMKTYVYEDSVFYHDISLDMIGKLLNVPRHVFTQKPNFGTLDAEIDYYSKTYPTYCNTLSEDDYHYQKRLEYYIQNYNKIYFPVLELWKYFHINSELVNRKVIVAEQNYSYLKNLGANEDKYINELGKNKFKAFYLEDEDYRLSEEKNLKKPRVKSVISPNDYINSKNGILIDSDGNYIRDKEGNFVKTNYVYQIVENEETGEMDYVITYDNISRTFYWYLAKIENFIYQIKLTKSLNVVPSTRYQLRFCVKEYPSNDLKLRIIYKNKKGNVSNVVETIPERKDYDEVHEYNELIYTNYKKEWGISCEYICTDFVTLDNAQNIEVILESESDFRISDVTLQRVTVNHFDSEYMKTTTDYNSCVYDLYADYTKIPSNIRYDDLSIFNKVLNRTLPLTKIGYFNFSMEDTSATNTMKLNTEINVRYDNLLVAEELMSDDHIVVDDTYRKQDGTYSYQYNFNRYIKRGNYEIIIKPFDIDYENNIVSDFNIDIIMKVFNEDNTVTPKTLTINNFNDYLENNDDGYYYRIPFENKSDTSLDIKIYRKNSFEFKNFKLIRESPLAMEEVTR